MLSNTSKYALRAVVYLAVNSDESKRIGLKRISGDLSIPTPFLGKILQLLARHKLLVSTKGPNGGFSLGMGADEIYLMDIIDIVEGQDVFNKCAIDVKFCSERENLCALHTRYASMRQKMKALFESETIGQLVDEVKTNRQSRFI